VGGAGAGDADSDLATGGSAVTHDVKPASNLVAQALRARNLACGARSRVGTAAPNLDRLISMAALAAVRLVLARSIEAGSHTPASFSQPGHVLLEERRINPAAATFAFLLDSGAVVGHLVTADAARCDPTSPAAMSSDPAELPPNTQKYRLWLLSNVGDPATVHDSQEAYRHDMRQPTVSGPDTTRLPACASCGVHSLAGGGGAQADHAACVGVFAGGGGGVCGLAAAAPARGIAPGRRQESVLPASRAGDGKAASLRRRRRGWRCARRCVGGSGPAARVAGAHRRCTWHDCR
jgi:hypothetical protein